MHLDHPHDFGDFLDDLEARADEGEERAKVILTLITAQLSLLSELPGPPDEDSDKIMLKRVRQSRRYPLWRVSHPYVEGIAIRLICWFPPESEAVFVALFAGDKATIGDVFYNSVASRADALIDQYKREVERWQK